MSDTVVEVEGLQISLEGSLRPIVTEITFAIGRGEVLGLVGESGSGKTTVGLALLGFCRPGARLTDGQVRIDAVDIFSLPPARLQQLRGAKVAYVAQDPAASLNPALRIGRQVSELLDEHLPSLSKAERAARLQEVFNEVALSSSPDFLNRFPHQLSGGQMQRLCLAMAFACRPAAIVLDEPTTGLDVTTQAWILETVRTLCDNHGVAALYVSHDLAVVSQVASRVAVMYAGRLAELGPKPVLFSHPAHPYTAGLVRAIPSIEAERTVMGIRGRAPDLTHRPAGCPFAPRCELTVDVCNDRFPDVTQLKDNHQVWCWRANEAPVLLPTQVDAKAKASITGTLPMLAVEGLRASYGKTEVLHGIDFGVSSGSTLAIVGESGSGKTTLAQCLVGLHRPDSGAVRMQGNILPSRALARTRDQRRQIQYIFQSPYTSLNPRKTVYETLEQPVRIFTSSNGKDVAEQVASVLVQVGLSAQFFGRYPQQLSGGERQRVAIARALVAGPAVLVCDEITSALDVSVQASIIELLKQLQSSRGLTMLFVTHNLALVRNIADEVVVLSKGSIAEYGTVQKIFGMPSEEYTRRLLADTPALEVSATA
jgi:peptide/nickel transport system ATP-binding protein